MERIILKSHGAIVTLILVIFILLILIHYKELRKRHLSNLLLTSILESSPDIIVFALDNNYCYLSFNSKHKETIKRIWGKEIEVGMSMLEVISDNHDKVKSKNNFDRALAGESFSVIEEYGDENLSRLIWRDYYSPICSDGTVVGRTCFVLDITEQERAADEVIYLSYHDELTGLYNRRFFQEELRRLDTKRNLPITIIIGDMNGLKLTNDIFGHNYGDILLQKTAEVLRKTCREDDIIARIGGDEFAILLPQTNSEEAMGLISRVRDQFSKENVKAIKGSISMGYDTKTNSNQDIQKVIRNAEYMMYSRKTLDRNDIKGITIKTIVETLHENNEREENHSKRIRKICEKIGIKLGLSEVQLRKLKEAGFFHDIGKITLDEELLNKCEKLTDHELKEKNQHPITGYRILNSFDSTLDLAEIILAHHERWDGTGYPRGLKGEEIPKLARVIAIAESYEEMVSGENMLQISKEKALSKIYRQAGTKFDPDIVDAFINIMNEDYNN